MEPGFYRCKSCKRTWQRTEWKTRQNPPARCPHCRSTDQEIDRLLEDEYVRRVYGPITQQIGQIIKDKIEKESKTARLDVKEKKLDELPESRLDELMKTLNELPDVVTGDVELTQEQVDALLVKETE